MTPDSLPTSVEYSRIDRDSVDVVIGNPPYINSRELTAEAKTRYLSQAQRSWPLFDWRRASDIYLYFWLHSAGFVREGGRLVLLTQSGWLDVDFGVPLQEWMLANFNIVAVIETEAEPWFTDARVATSITVLQKTNAPDPANSVRFVQLSATLSTILTETQLNTPESIAENISRGDGLDGYIRVRTVPQGQLVIDGHRSGGQYVGSRWGRHIRTPDALYELYAEFADSFTVLSEIATIHRGITTNCDDFFLVENISDETLSRVSSASHFREMFGVSRQRVQGREVKIIRRKDGAEFALPSVNLTPIMKTARDFQSFNTGGLESRSLAVCLDSDRRHLGSLSERYVAAGEREGWHRSSSFASCRSNWFVLRGAEPSPILFPKTSQYTPVVLLNDAELLANQRLYEIRPSAGIDERALWAVLNSTLFAFERYTAAKQLGREAAIDIEVFTAEALRIPDLRIFSHSQIERLRQSAETLLSESPSPALDEPLMQLGRSAAMDFIDRTPVAQEAWPPFMTSPSRMAIDLILLESIGVEPNNVQQLRERLCNELLGYTRKLKTLEFQAQENRRGTSSSGVSPREIASDALQQILADRQLSLRRIPQDFVPENSECEAFFIPASGKLTLIEPDLFSGTLKGKIRGHELTFASSGQAALVGFLAKHGLSGTLNLPIDSLDCETTLTAIERYLAVFSDEFDSAAASVSSDIEFQARVLRQGMDIVLHND